MKHEINPITEVIGGLAFAGIVVILPFLASIIEELIK